MSDILKATMMAKETSNDDTGARQLLERFGVLAAGVKSAPDGPGAYWVWDCFRWAHDTGRWRIVEVAVSPFGDGKLSVHFPGTDYVADPSSHNAWIGPLDPPTVTP